MCQVVSGGEKMVGQIAIISCSFILGNREALSDKNVFEQRPEGSEGASEGRVPGRREWQVQKPRGGGFWRVQQEGLYSKSRVSERSSRKSFQM